MLSRRSVIVGAHAILATYAIASTSMSARRTGMASPQVLRRTRRLDGETVALRDYCVANGTVGDAENLQALIDLGPAKIVYPSDARVTLDRAIRLTSNQTHLFADGARIDAHVGGYALGGVGLTAQPLAGLSAPIARGDRIIRLASTGDIVVGDMIVLADVAASRGATDVNLVARVSAGVIETRYPIGREFAAADDFRLYRVYAPLRNVRLIGRVTASNRHPNGGMLRLNTARDAVVEGLRIAGTGHIAMAFENSVGASFADVAVADSGASALGLRVAKAVVISRLAARGTRSDESLTFYENVSDTTATDIAIVQYLHQDRAGRSAGNNILIDRLCARIALSRVRCTGSATYNVMIHDRSDACSIDDFDLRQSNLGGIRVSGRCRGTRVGKGLIADVRDIVDQEAKKPVSAISVGTDCRDTAIDSAIRFEAIATGRRIGAISGDNPEGPR